MTGYTELHEIIRIQEHILDISRGITGITIMGSLAR